MNPQTGAVDPGACAAFLAGWSESEEEWIAEGFEHHIPKGYVYFAMAFSVCVEMLNIRLRKRAKQVVSLHKQDPMA